jgi:hypothetical protein
MLSMPIAWLASWVPTVQPVPLAMAGPISSGAEGFGPSEGSASRIGDLMLFTKGFRGNDPGSKACHCGVSLRYSFSIRFKSSQCISAAHLIRRYNKDTGKRFLKTDFSPLAKDSRMPEFVASPPKTE